MLLSDVTEALVKLWLRHDVTALTLDRFDDNPGDIIRRDQVDKELVLGAGKNAIRISPPLVLTKPQAETAVKIIDAALGEAGV